MKKATLSIFSILIISFGGTVSAGTHTITASANNKTGYTTAICPEKHVRKIVGISESKTSKVINGGSGTTEVYDKKMNKNIAWTGGHIHK